MDRARAKEGRSMLEAAWISSPRNWTCTGSQNWAMAVSSSWATRASQSGRSRAFHPRIKAIRKLKSMTMAPWTTWLNFSNRARPPFFLKNRSHKCLRPLPTERTLSSAPPCPATISRSIWRTETSKQNFKASASTLSTWSALLSSIGPSQATLVSRTLTTTLLKAFQNTAASKPTASSWSSSSAMRQRSCKSSRRTSSRVHGMRQPSSWKTDLTSWWWARSRVARPGASRFRISTWTCNLVGIGSKYKEVEANRFVIYYNEAQHHLLIYILISIEFELICDITLFYWVY